MRKKKSAIAVAERTTGNPSPPPPMSDADNMVIHIIGKETSVGIDGVEEAGFPSGKDTANVSSPIEEENTIHECATNTHVEENEEPQQKKTRVSYNRNVRSDMYAEYLQGTNDAILVYIFTAI